MGAQLMAVVTEGKTGRNYYAPLPEHEEVLEQISPEEILNTELPEQALGFRVQRYGMTRHRDLFSPRQLMALSTFSSLVNVVRDEIYKSALNAGMSQDPSSECNAQSYADAVSVYLAFSVDKSANYWSTLCAWYSAKEIMMSTFGRQALSMTWDYAEANPFSDSSGNFML